jgi:hypothetical protein
MEVGCKIFKAAAVKYTNGAMTKSCTENLMQVSFTDVWNVHPYACDHLQYHLGYRSIKNNGKKYKII